MTTNFEEFRTTGGNSICPVDMAKLKAGAKSIKHSEDYGQLWLNPKTGDIFWTAGDSDDPEEGYHSEDEIKQIFREIPGVGEIEVESECYPNKDRGFIEINY